MRGEGVYWVGPNLLQNVLSRGGQSPGDGAGAQELPLGLLRGVGGHNRMYKLKEMKNSPMS